MSMKKGDSFFEALLLFSGFTKALFELLEKIDIKANANTKRSSVDDMIVIIE